MGSPIGCYKNILINYIKQNTCWTKYDKQFSNEYLSSLSENELENIVKKFNQQHRDYACFMAGAAVANFLNSCTGDEANASSMAIDMLFELFNIDESNEVDFNGE